MWCNFWILKPGSQAILAFVFGEYLAAAVSGANLDVDDNGDDALPKTWATLLAIGAVVLLTAFNTLNIRSSANFQNALSVVKTGMIFVIFVVGLAHAAATDGRMLERNFGKDLLK